jgi:hypothetical protein
MLAQRLGGYAGNNITPLFININFFVFILFSSPVKTAYLRLVFPADFLTYYLNRIFQRHGITPMPVALDEGQGHDD